MIKLLLLPFFTLLFSANSSAQHSEGQRAVILRIDPASATSGTASQLFEGINYIPLETTKESLFGTIDQLEVTDKYFIIMDRDTKSILIFEKDGKFHAKITSKPLSVQKFLYEKDSDRILVDMFDEKSFTPEIQAEFSKNVVKALDIIMKLRSTAYYDTEGKKSDVAVPKDLTSISSLTQSIVFPNGISISNFTLADSHLPDSTAYELNFYKNNIAYRSYFPYNTKKDIVRFGRDRLNAGGFTKSQNDTTVYFTRAADYSIYKITPYSFTKIFEFIFPLRNTIPKNYFEDSLSPEKRKTYWQENRSLVKGLSNVRLIGNSLFFKIENTEINMEASNSLLYNLKSRNLISVNKYTPDEKSYFLPVFGQSFSYESFKTNDERYLYNFISSLEMFDAKERTADKKPVYNPVLDNYFKKESRKSNPVIVQLKPKENL